MSDERSNPLGPLADADVPELDALTRDRLEAGLRVQHADRQSAPNRRGLPRRFVIGPLVALVLIAATIALLVRDEAAVAALMLSDAENVTITLPDGVVVTDPADGFALRDGAVVVVGADGRATIDDVMLAAGTVVRVRDGRLVTDVVATTTTKRPGQTDDAPQSRDDSPSEVRPSTTTTAPVDLPRSDGTGSGSTGVAPTPTQAPQRPPEPDRPPDDSPPAAGSVDDDLERDVAIALRVSLRDGGVRITWSTEGVAETGWRVVVVRTVDAGDGQVIGEGERGERTEAMRDFPSDVATLRYRVFVLDESDGVVARSAVQSLTLR